MEKVYSLYTKYRPKTFEEVVGQEKLVKTLASAIEKNEISHAYLFVGTRGVGKTTLARIFAKTLGVSEKDIYELDAASNSGVDNVREIIEASQLLPFESKYKVYILDEAHMFSKSAFNALLKTLEEPPSHVIFILATTEYDKIPETIASRCQTFFLNTPSQEEIVSLVETVAKKEGFEIDKQASKMIAIAGNHSFRDALVALQKVISVAKDKKITEELASSVLDVPPVLEVENLARAILKKDPDQVLDSISKINNANSDWILTLNLLIEILRKVYVAQVSNSAEIGELKEELKQAGSISAEDILNLMSLFEIMKFSPNKKIALEMGALSVVKKSQ